MNITDFHKGWFVGNFEPSLLQRDDVEVGLRWNEVGSSEPRHYHKLNSEYVVFAGGKHRLNDRVFHDGEMTVIHPYMSGDYECLEPGYCLTVRDRSDASDKYPGQPVNLVIPMAGKGQRFKDAGYTVRKPLIDIAGMPMIARVIENFKPTADHRILLIGRDSPVFGPFPGRQEFILDHETEGAVSTMLEAEHLIGREDPLLIANCDQLILDFDVNDFIEKSADCSVTVFESDVPHHSYVKEANGLITEVAEKQVISNKAVAGVYFYRKAKYFFDNAKKMIAANDRTNGEFYNTPVFNYIIQSGLTVNAYTIPGDKMQILGTPAELKVFEDKLAQGEITL